MNPWSFFIAVAGFLAGMIGLIVGYLTEDIGVMVFWGILAVINQNTWQFEARKT